ncbi:YetF domain-containing protein [Ureibacillus acetophenoni]|uniref:Uncharacterized membrane protein YcaP n=1 Tax=Ureibacillus acetophenoni TaxID=614649 RepID=A0A285UEH3_9BACL|nr:DUF421 domain-containing protein [Ureibacillus acetophenoni]SOC40163.1 uncharacterized membrane protein YcaP [Ureibacillus acetophenoni]
MKENISYFQIIIETVSTFFVLLIMTRLLGKKQLSHLTFFNYITGITIGSLAANMVLISTRDFFKELTTLIIWCLLSMIIAYIGLKSGKARVVLDGEPTILIKKGVIDKKSLSSTKLNIDDLTMLLRQKDVFSITEVDYAILEPNGTLSVLKKQQSQNVQKKDLNIDLIMPTYIPTEIIVDGKIIADNLKELGLSNDWLNKQLENAGVYSTKEVLYAEIQSDGQLYIQSLGMY